MFLLRWNLRILCELFKEIISQLEYEINRWLSHDLLEENELHCSNEDLVFIFWKIFSFRLVTGWNELAGSSCSSVNGHLVLFNRIHIWKNTGIRIYFMV